MHPVNFVVSLALRNQDRASRACLQPPDRTIRWSYAPRRRFIAVLQLCVTCAAAAACVCAGLCLRAVSVAWSAAVGPGRRRLGLVAPLELLLMDRSNRGTTLFSTQHRGCIARANRFVRARHQTVPRVHRKMGAGGDGAASAAPTIAGRPLVPGEEPLSDGNSNLKAWQPVYAVDARDQRCADSWIPRHPDLIRLTGKHPFNSEPPHEDVMKEGWLTPVSKHFVRNHGAVPKLKWESHRIRISGLVGKPLELSMDELAKLPAVTVPCLLTCCGNRRKEVNMLKNSQGFSWGPGAVSVNYWTGARLSDVLKAAGVKTPDEGAQCALACCFRYCILHAGLPACASTSVRCAQGAAPEYVPAQRSPKHALSHANALALWCLRTRACMQLAVCSVSCAHVIQVEEDRFHAGGSTSLGPRASYLRATTAHMAPT